MRTPQIIIIAILFSGMMVSCKQSEIPSEYTKPNIIFVLADDLGYGDLGSYGQQKLKTPHLDQMAEQGMRFTQAYAGNTVCCPSRSCLLTGLHPGHARHRGNYGPFRGKNARIPFEKGTKTMATYLKEAGYSTGHIGKWHLGGMHKDSTSAIFLGFDHSYSRFPNYLWTTDIKAALRGKHSSYYPDTIWRNNEKILIEENVNLGMQVYCEELYTEEALDFIRTNKDSPFFLYLAYTIPHAPQVPYSEEPFEHENWPEVERKFAAEVYYLDQNMGKIFSLLKELGIDENTLVIFSSDNGAHHEGGHDHEFFNSNGELRGYKRDMYDGGIKVPMIARWPGSINAGSVTDHICAFWDLLPTFTDLAGIEAPENIDGISFAPTLLGLPDEQVNHDYLYWELVTGAGGRQGVRLGKWKAVRYDINTLGPDAPIELYDVSVDIGEQNNLADHHPEAVRKVEEIMNEAHIENPYFKYNYELER